MKNIAIFILFIVVAFNASAQLVRTNPAVFTAEDEVTFTIDASLSSNESLVGFNGDVWAWVFISSGCTANCDAPSNINPAGGPETDPAKMTRDPDNPDVYSITFVPTEFFGKSPGEIQQIGFVLKSVDWGDGIQTQDFTVDVTPIEFVPNENRSFPSKFTQEDIVTIYFDQSLSDDNAVNDLNEVFVFPVADIRRANGTLESDFEIVSEDEVINTPSLQMTKRGYKLFSLTIIPENLFQLGTGDEIISIKYNYVSSDGLRKSATRHELFLLSLD
ncbi:DUF4961 domain-containing protein [Fulvivirga lutea]|uniref:Uncharacterized protein n=1 Tax=Fulvivirga lutea TaxID=2810512 RepID=A0A974WED3_9BACT|nr:hypothetical protein [Fulvivirga lutea]QSE96240.1 hypothetical protein JR347_11520 [Fulvivirga lutea]